MSASVELPPVFIAFQDTSDTRPIVDAILADNPAATRQDFPSMVKIDCPGRLVVNRVTVEENLGRAFDLRELHLHLISIAGSVDETDDSFILEWRGA